MDAGKIRSFLSSVDVRADADGAQSGRRSDAGTVVPKVAPLLALDALLTSADAELKNEMPVVPHKPSGVVVSLSFPALSAEAALKLARVIPNAADYSHLDPHKPHPERNGNETLSEPAEILRAAAVASGSSIERAAREPSSPPPASPDVRPDPYPTSRSSPDVRPDLYPHGVPHAAQSTRHTNAASEKPALSLDQARHAERLAGLAARTGQVALSTPAGFAKLLVGAAIVGALIVLLL